MLSIEISDQFWNKVVWLLPKSKRNTEQKYIRKKGGGRKKADLRIIFCGILYILKTGCQWEYLPKEFGAKSTVNKYFKLWLEAGFFKKLWERGLNEYDEMKGIAWQWQSIDGCHIKAPGCTDKASESPVDRKKKRFKEKSTYRRIWYPIIINNRGCKNS